MNISYVNLHQIMIKNIDKIGYEGDRREIFII